MAGGNIKVVVRGKYRLEWIWHLLTWSSTALQWQGAGPRSKMCCEDGW